ncbi:MAG TPA: hypothetical protein VHY08_08605 [Bacillota bacterium]|nr:hypothetical protein [Bacillota bacterium]
MKTLIKAGLILSLIGCLALAGCGGKSPVTKELYYDASDSSATIAGYGGVPLSAIQCCVIFDTTKLSPYVNGRIIAVKLFNPNATTTYSYNPVVYEADSCVDPTTPISKNASASPINCQSWKTINLETPVTIQSSKVYWVGFEATGLTASDYAEPVGSNPDYHNNKQSTNGSNWGNVSYNWVVRILVRK